MNTKPLPGPGDEATWPPCANHPNDPRTAEDDEGPNCELHIFEDGGDWQVWLNTEVAHFDGLCIGAAVTRIGAVEQAIRELEFALDELQREP